MSVAIGAVGVVALLGGGWLLAQALVRARVAGRLGAPRREVPATPRQDASPRREASARGALARWLASAGYTAPDASARFAAIQAGALAAAGAATLLSGWLAGGADLASLAGSIPVFGSAAAMLAAALPLVLGAGIAAAPALAVRRARRSRADAIEEDLPMALELLAALSEAGLGFDAAVARLQAAEFAARPLASELRVLQREAAAGSRRVDSLRRFAERVDRPTARSVVAALVQAEEVGSGIADVLRPLANDLRAQRRERALARAEALPDKLVVALVLGFLPGLLYWTLGPSLLQLFVLLDGVQLR